jgi:hypothetical protein
MLIHFDRNTHFRAGAALDAIFDTRAVISSTACTSSSRGSFEQSLATGSGCLLATFNIAFEVADSFWCSSFSAELPGTASGEYPAPGTGAPSAFNGTTTRISLLLLAGSVAKFGSEVDRVETVPISATNPFKGRQYPGEVILQAVRWYLRYPLAYEHVAELLAERSLDVDASYVWRWVQAYSPELNKRCRPHLKHTNKSYRVDET